MFLNNNLKSQFTVFIYGRLKVILFKKKFYYLSGIGFENMYNKSTHSLFNYLMFNLIYYF